MSLPCCVSPTLTTPPTKTLPRTSPRLPMEVPLLLPLACCPVAGDAAVAAVCPAVWVELLRCSQPRVAKTRAGDLICFLDEYIIFHHISDYIFIQNFF